MASLLLRPLLRPQTLGLSLGLSLATYHTISQRPLCMDTIGILRSPTPNENLRGNDYPRNAKTPVVRGGKLNPTAIRQISSGSIIGLCAGLVVSTFSRSLALILVLIAAGVQWASFYGISVTPYNCLQKYVKGIDLRSAAQDNVAFKISFGTTFALAAFKQF